MSQPTERTSGIDAAAAAVPPCAQPSVERRTIFSRAGDIVKKLGPAGPLALVSLLLPVVGAALLLGAVARLAPWLKANVALAAVLCGSAGALLCGTALMPTYAMSLLDGFVLGKTLGLLTAMSGLAIASLVGYAVSRWITGDRVVQTIAEHPRGATVMRALVGGSFWRTTGVVTLVRIAPVSTFGITNVLMSAVRVPVGPYLLGTIFGMLPRTALMVFAGAGLSRLTFDHTHHGPHRWLAMAVGLGISFLALGGLGLIAKHALDRMAKGEPPKV